MARAEDIVLEPDQKIDDLHIGALKIIQSRNRFMYGIDAVLISDYAKVKNGEEVVELGTGTGIIPILLAATTRAKKITALEVQTESARMAENSVKLNRMEDRIQIVNADLREIKKIIPPQSVNVVVSNPPYMKASGAVENQNQELAIARHEIMCTLEDVLKAASFVLKPNGRFYMIHKPQRLDQIIRLGAESKLAVKKMRLVVPEVDKAPTMVMVEMVKCGAEGLEIEPNLVVYKEKGIYSEEVERIYKKC